MQSIDIQAFTYEEREGMMPALTTTVSLCGAWIVDRRTISPTSLEICLEIQLRSIVDLYAALIAAGVELTRDGHQALSGLCTFRKHFSTTIPHLVNLRLELTFLEELTLHSILSIGASAA